MPESDENKTIKRAAKEVAAWKSEGKTDAEISKELGIPEAMLEVLKEQGK